MLLLQHCCRVRLKALVKYETQGFMNSAFTSLHPSVKILARAISTSVVWSVDWHFLCLEQSYKPFFDHTKSLPKTSLVE